MFPISSIGRMLLNAAVRRALWSSPKALLIAAALVGLVLMSIGTARAATYPTQAAAYAGCMAAAAGAEGYFATRNPKYANPHCVQNNATYWAMLTDPGNGAAVWINQLSGHGFDGLHAWTNVTNCPPGAVVMLKGQCSATPEECTAFNSGGGFGVQTT